MFQWLSSLRRRPRAAPRTAASAAASDSSIVFDDEFQRRLESLAIAARRVVKGRARAERRSRTQGSGIEFADHREYVPGDDFRAVDWNAYQRFGRLFLRLYEEEEDLSVYLLVDASASMGFGTGAKLWQAKRLAAALAWVALARLDRVTVVALDDGLRAQLPTTRGKNRGLRVLRFLEGLRPDGATSLEPSLRAFAARYKRRGVAVLLSDLYDPAGFEGAVDVLRFNRFEPYVIHVVDPTDGLPDFNGDLQLADCESGDVRDVTVTEGLRRRLAQAHREHVEAVERYSAAKHVPRLAAPVDQPFDDLVLRALRRGGLLR